MRELVLPRVYPITDRRLAGLSHAEQVAQLVAGDAKMIQLREKHLEAGPFYEQALAAVGVARAHGALVIINDRVDVALAVQADGVHLGQTDLPPEAARRLLGRRAIIGFSTHNVEQAMAAARLPIDYLAIGPIFATASKEKPDPVVGLEGLRRVRASLEARDLPLVAIGGITHANARSVIEAGADAVAVISAVVAPDGSIERRFRDLQQALA